MGYINPTTTDFRNYFFRDFMFTTAPDLSGVVEQDIQNAQADVSAFMNTDLFQDQSTYTLGFQLLTAHFLATNIVNSSSGLSSQFSWPAGSKSVGSVSESQSIPSRIMENPEFAYLTKTGYGAKYLMLVLPLLSGNISCVAGATQP